MTTAKTSAAFNYSFAPLDLVHYVGDFIAGRKAYLEHLFKKTENQAITPDNIGLWRALLPPSLDESAQNTGAIDTFQGLSRVLREHAMSGQFSAPALQMINNLQRRFEVDRHLKEKYQTDFRKEESPECPPLVYALFSIALSLAYSQTGNFNYFNTVLKVNDLMIKSDGAASEKVDPLYTAAALLEFEALKNFHAL